MLVDGKYGALYVNGSRVYLNDEPVVDTSTSEANTSSRTAGALPW